MFLYHYCDNRKLAKIISGHTLRMSDISKSNDYEEVQLFYPYIMPAIERVYKTNPFPIVYEGENDLAALEKILHTVHKYINAEFDEGEMTSFVVCFCEKGDVLSQWRGYSENGKGGAIGFSLEELKQYCKSYDDVISIKKVQYISRGDLPFIIEDNAKLVILDWQKEMEWVTEKFTIEEGSDEYSTMLRVSLFHNIKKALIRSLEYKYDAFSEEKEWRLFFSEEITKNSKYIYADKEGRIMKYHNVIPKLRNKIEFNVTDTDLIPYYPIDLLELSPEPIKEVILGPNNKILKKDFELYMAKCNMKNYALKYSAISFRG